MQGMGCWQAVLYCTVRHEVQSRSVQVLLAAGSTRTPDRPLHPSGGVPSPRPPGMQSFSWHLHYQRQSLTEHILVFWTAPILGALSAGALYSLLSTPSKKRRRSRPALQSKKQH